MIVGAILPEVINVLRFDVTVSTAISFLSVKVAFVAIFAALAAYGSYRIELSESAARAALVMVSLRAPRMRTIEAQFRGPDKREVRG